MIPVSQGQENLHNLLQLFSELETVPSGGFVYLLMCLESLGMNYSMDVSPTTTIAQKTGEVSGAVWFHSSLLLYNVSLPMPSEAENCHLGARGCTATLLVADVYKRDVRVKGVTFTNTWILGCPGHLRKLSVC